MSLRPTPRTWRLAVLGVGLAALPAVVAPSLTALWVGFVGGLALLLGVEALRAPRLADLDPVLDLPDQVVVGRPQPMGLRLAGPGGRTPLRVEAEIEADPRLGTGAPFTGVVDPREGVVLTGAFAPTHRGAVPLDALWLRWRGPWGLLECVARRPLDRRVTVLPDLATTRQAALAMDGARRSGAGLKVERYVGDGSEFDTMREYVSGMDARSISWRATARHRRLVCHQFRAERNHPVVLAFDAGRLMGETLGGTTRLDHALHGGLLLAWSALRTGDRVGWYAFDATPRVWIPPAGSRGTFSQLRRAAGELAYGTHETNYTLGLFELIQRLRRRSLVVLLTDMVDSVGAQLLMDNVERLLRRHVVLFVTLQDPGLVDAAEAAPASAAALARAVVAQQLRRDRAAVLEHLARRGALVLDAPPERLGPTLVARYLDAKRRERV